MSAVDGPLERRLELLMLLRDASPLTRAEIAERLPVYAGDGEAARQLFERDKRMLKSVGVPVATLAAPGAEGPRYTVDRAEYDLPALDLTPEEQAALSLAATMVDFEAGWEDGAVRKLGGPGAVPAPVVASLPADDHLPALHAALRRRHPVRFGYRGRPRLVHGQGFLFREGHWYLVAEDEGVRKTFRVDRIEGTVEVDDRTTYEIADRVRPADALPRDPLEIGGDTRIEARVRIAGPPARREARRRPEGAVWSADESAVELLVPVTNRDAFRSWLLGLRDHAEVLGPPELRDEIVDWLRAVTA
jgi:predicted DNA-binding transcriptional regulator YafY